MAGCRAGFRFRWRADNSDQVRFGHVSTYQEMGLAVKGLLRECYNVVIERVYKGTG